MTTLDNTLLVAMLYLPEYIVTLTLNQSKNEKKLLFYLQCISYSNDVEISITPSNLLLSAVVTCSKIGIKTCLVQRTALFLLLSQLSLKTNYSLYNDESNGMEGIKYIDLTQDTILAWFIKLNKC